MATQNAQRVVDFWRSAGPDRWYEKNADFDAEIARRFGRLVEQAAAGELDDWLSDADSALALVVLTDQFPRNLFRGRAQAFHADAKARAVADVALRRGFDAQVDPVLRQFFYLPFMHSELLADQQRGVALYRACGDRDGEGWAVVHHDLIARFGRFPHRNAALGRTTTEAEAAYLATEGFKG